MTSRSESASAILYEGESRAMDLEELHRDAVHEREEALRRELESKAKRKSKLIDALEYSLDIDEIALAEYEPAMPWEFEPPHPGNWRSSQR
jgi:hypothetical protein